MTQTHPGIPEELRGTYAGLAHPAVIDHLHSLGVTAIELMPRSCHGTRWGTP
ncbi:Glycogen operon protein GlgX homolog [Mycobacteroides abscessus subsp. abscessus]|nr:Glycogen operon protein GlgX homolog [Mycobacteroides abscessus subsp. abscessus]